MKKVLAAVLLPVMALGLVLGPSVASATSASGGPLDGSKAQVVVNSDGKVLVRGAKVTAVSGATITAEAAWGSKVLAWTVVTDSATKFYNRAGSNGVLADIAVSDVISFTGPWDTGAGLSVRAQGVRDWTGSVSNATVSGEVESVATTSFVIEHPGKGNDKDVTVSVTNATTITFNNATTTLASIGIGDKVKAAGTLSSDGTSLAATSVVIVKKDDNSSDDDKDLKRWLNGKGFDFFKSGKGKSHDD